MNKTVIPLFYLNIGLVQNQSSDRGKNQFKDHNLTGRELFVNHVWHYSCYSLNASVNMTFLVPTFFRV